MAKEAHDQVAKAIGENQLNDKKLAKVIPIQLLSAVELEVDRVLTICNACRYCEGFCAVFQAMTRRLDFQKNDIHYLANLCHNCGACLHACQYAPPHEFGVNVPRAMAKVRAQTYGDYAWPARLGGLYRNNGLTIVLALALGLALFLIMGVLSKGSLIQAPGPNGFYDIFPHGLMVSLFAPVFIFSAFALFMGLAAFWKVVDPEPVLSVATLSVNDRRSAQTEAVHAAFKLKYLEGGHGEGCNNEDDAFTLARRRFHHFTFYGFLLCFAATSVATLFHYAFQWPAPYGYLSLPKLLGISGGVSMLIGTIGLWRLNFSRHPLQGDPEQAGMDRGFIALLFLTASTGLALMLARGTTALPLLLCVHLGIVMALFLTMPYSKFAHGFYRSAALLKFAIEKRQPNRLAAGTD
jgi:citrate/tricarballylate utilization protein